jgi:glycosyltransferase involved in cell wall biosynthesis
VAGNQPTLSSGPRLRVLQIIGSPGMGGTEVQLLHFLQRYDRTRMMVDVVCVQSVEGELRNDYLATGTRLHHCRWSAMVLPFSWRLMRFLKQHRYDVVHARLSEVSGAAMAAACAAGVPNRIASYHHTEIRWRRPGTVNRLATKCLILLTRFLASQILGVSEACLDAYHPEWRRRTGRFKISHNGVPVERFCLRPKRELRTLLNIPDDAFVIGHVGSFREAKNHSTIVEVAGLVVPRAPKALFLLVGDGPLRERIETEVNEHDLAGRFLFTGTRHDIPELMAAMNVFLIPSLYEGFATAAIEAQLSSLPVIASDLHSLREILCPEMQAFCRRPEDAEGMSDLILQLLANVELRTALGMRGREYVKHRFSIDRMVCRLERVYEGFPD